MSLCFFERGCIPISRVGEPILQKSESGCSIKGGGGAINQCLTDFNRCLTDINRYLTDTENQFYKVSVISVKYRFVSVISVKYRFAQISTLVIFKRYLTNTNRYILEIS